MTEKKGVPLCLMILIMSNLLVDIHALSPCFPTNYPFGSYGLGGNIIYYDFDVKPDGTSIALGGSCNDGSICVPTHTNPII